MNIPSDRQYTAEHEWIDAQGRVGITDYAQDALGDVVFVELPAVGLRVKAGEAFGAVESVKSVSDLFSPANGVVAAVNQKLVDQPELLNQDPYTEGWIVKFENGWQGQDLISHSEYVRQIGGTV